MTARLLGPDRRKDKHRRAALRWGLMGGQKRHVLGPCGRAESRKGGLSYCVGHDESPNGQTTAYGGFDDWLTPSGGGKNHKPVLGHDLRHTYASLLLAEGAPLTYVAQQMGHSKPTTTLRFYAKWIPSKGRWWVNVLDSEGAMLEPESGTNGGQRLVSAGAGGGT